jgi:osmotically-inducible protein OsmY
MRDDRVAPSGVQSQTKISNADLEKSIRAKLERDEQLKQANLSINGDAEKNEVTLSVTVATQDARARAVDLAKSAQAGLTVNDKIDVKPAA